MLERFLNSPFHKLSRSYDLYDHNNRCEMPVAVLHISSVLYALPLHPSPRGRKDPGWRKVGEGPALVYI